MRRMLRTTITAGLGGMALMATGLSGVAHAASEVERYTHSSCDDEGASCGVIVMGNGGGYILEWVEVKAHTAQPSNAPSGCSNVGKKIGEDVDLNQYVTFIVPASCSYKLKLKIKSANQKDKNIYLTPGCQVIAEVKGTATDNTWKSLKVSALNNKVPTTSGGTPIDSLGNKCGQLGSSGF